MRQSPLVRERSRLRRQTIEYEGDEGRTRRSGSGNCRLSLDLRGSLGLRGGGLREHGRQEHFEARDFLSHAVFVDLEVVRAEIEDGLPPAVARDDIDDDGGCLRLKSLCVGAVVRDLPPDYTNGNGEHHTNNNHGSGQYVQSGTPYFATRSTRRALTNRPFATINDGAAEWPALCTIALSPILHSDRRC